VLNGLTANGSLVTGSGSTYQRNGFKRYKAGNVPQGFSTLSSAGDANTAIRSLGGTRSGNFWCDDGSPI
jgi:hypothetical protein